MQAVGLRLSGLDGWFKVLGGCGSPNCFGAKVVGSFATCPACPRRGLGQLSRWGSPGDVLQTVRCIIHHVVAPCRHDQFMGIGTQSHRIESDVWKNTMSPAFFELLAPAAVYYKERQPGVNPDTTI